MQFMKPDTDVLDIIKTVFAILLPIAVFTIPQVSRWRSAGGAITKALCGDIEMLQRVAYKVQEDRWRGRLKSVPTKRKDVIRALCLGWSSTDDHHQKLLIFKAMQSLLAKYEDDVRYGINKINKEFVDYQEVFNETVFEERIKANQTLIEKLNIR